MRATRQQAVHPPGWFQEPTASSLVLRATAPKLDRVSQVPTVVAAYPRTVARFTSQPPAPRRPSGGYTVFRERPMWRWGDVLPYLLFVCFAAGVFLEVERLERQALTRIGDCPLLTPGARVADSDVADRVKDAARAVRDAVRTP